ncbi:DUF4091 domain-containing protein [Lentibacillus saliphilus]|uniref:DUF4091 domain-containing protein n=1 Tax=Lentibacillus saliphilus TaxID=2737028 RepID=UPI001C2F7C89|nr:DUF4091 domain-containing protein [Lentibacillus saliphilus]
MAIQAQLETTCLSSLTKVFPDQDLYESPYIKGSALLGERFSFQIAYRVTGPLMKHIQVTAQSDLKEAIQIRTVGLVPSEFPCYHDHDDDVLRSTPGLYPDPLYPITEEGITAFSNQWRSLWVTVSVNEYVTPGVHNIDVHFTSPSGHHLATETFSLTIIPLKLPEQQLIHTQWFHTDCLADQYDVDIFSEQHWQLIDQYVQTAVDNGINMILTPLFTPPLDTAIGAERPTVQLVDIEKKGENYHFSFDRLLRWIDMCTERGIQYFEFSHLFTQWGAYHAPKIIAVEDGVRKQIFGWDTDTARESYRTFLNQFLPELVTFIKQQKLDNRVYFHVSDEPSADHLTSYQSARDIIQTHLGAYPIMDALSDYAFYEKGIVKQPIPANDHIEPFLAHDVPDLWTYYCCVQYKDVSNRFFAFPSYRNRVIGIQLYKFDIKGFLHWGYNFWYTQFSKKSIDPFRHTDAGHGFPSGDAFLVYPGEDGPIESLRMAVFYEGLQDLRALQLLEGMIGKENVVALLEEDIDTPLTFKNYPRQQDWLLNKRDVINHKIAEHITV